MATVEELRLQIKADVADAVGKLKQYQRTTKETEQSNTTLASTFAKMRDVMQSPVAAGKMIIGAFKQVKAVTDQMEGDWAKQEKAVTNLESVLKATGGTVGLTSRELQHMAAELQNVTTFGDETIIAAQSIMLTFREIGEDVFPGAIEAAMDMATVFGGDLNGKVMQLGKALNDPIQGVSALTRVGIQFTDKQKALIESFVATNDMASAQGVIMDEVTKQVGGASRAAGEMASALKDRLANAISDVNEQIGRSLTNQMAPYRQAFLNIAQAIGASLKAQNDFRAALAMDNKGMASLEDQLVIAEETLRKMKTTTSSFGGITSQLDTANLQSTIAGLKEQIALNAMHAQMSAARTQAERDAIAKLEADRQVAAAKQAEVNAAYVEARKEVLGILQSEQTEYDKIQKQIDYLQKMPWASGDLEKDRLAAIEILRKRQADLTGETKEEYNAMAAAAEFHDQRILQSARDANAKKLQDYQGWLDAKEKAEADSAERIIAFQQKIEDAFTDAYANMAMALGEAMVLGEDGWKSFGKAGMNAVAAVMEAMAKEFTVRAGAALLLGNFAASAGFMGLATAAYVGAGAVKAIPMAEGGSGTVDKPTLFLAGEAGKEDFIFAPHSKGGMKGGGVTIIQNIAGSIWTTQQLQALAVGAVDYDGRGF
jgi:hypothetical protein